MSLKVCQKFIDDYFNKEDDSSVSNRIMKIVLKNEYFRGLNYNNKSSNSIINFFMDLDDKLNAFDYYFENEFINQVFYIDNVSILDFEENNSKFMPLHKSELIEKLYLYCSLECILIFIYYIYTISNSKYKNIDIKTWQ